MINITSCSVKFKYNLINNMYKNAKLKNDICDSILEELYLTDKLLDCQTDKNLSKLNSNLRNYILKQSKKCKNS